MNVDEEEIKVLLDEYKTSRVTIETHLEAAFTTTNITIVAIGAVLATASYIIDNKITILFALFAFVFHTIIWIQLRFVLASYSLSCYIDKTIAPRIRLLLKKVSTNNYEHLFSWESTYQSKNLYTKEVWRFPIEAARHGLPLSAASALTFFFIITMDTSGFLPWINVIIASGLCVLFIYSLWAIIKTRAVLRSGELK